MTKEGEYEQAIEYLYSQLPMFSRIGAAAYKPGLDTSIALDNYFHNPHKRFKSIHIGGTNGKGSTSHMVASILQSQGFKVGLYTSPHLVDFRERMRINGEMIPKEKVVDFVDSWKKAGYEGHPSFFELTMIMAFNWFAEEEVDFAVIEVGMGGRLDSTNIITPIVSVITNISHDHNQFLGDTLQEIANEKAGIIKKNTPVVIGERQKECEKVFLEKAKQENAPLQFASDNILMDISENKDDGGWNLSYKGKDIRLPLGGEYQKKNVLTVLTTIEQLRQLGIEISDASLKEGIENVIGLTGFMGRWTILSKSPLTIADTGHNIGGLEYNFSQLQRLLKEHHGGVLKIVIGFVADKAIEKIMKLLPVNAVYYITNASIPRALSASELQKKFIEAGLDSKVYPDVETAYSQAVKDSSPEDIIYIGGSTFIVADLFAFLNITPKNQLCP